MSRIALRHVIGRRDETRALVSAVADALGSPLTIEDAEGRVLHGNGVPVAAPSSFPVTYENTHLGWVRGPAQAHAVAAMLDHLVAREVERKALGAEVLHLYREINLIYSFSEKIAALLDLDRVATLILHEARTLIVATDGVIMLLDEDTGALSDLGGFGEELTGRKGFRRGHGIIGAVAQSGTAEVVNDVNADPRRAVEHTAIGALMCAPLKVGERVLGVIALGSTLLREYTAAELKLLTTLALQAAVAIENARLFERTVQAARERERLMELHQQTEVARAKLQRDLDLAARIQADLFPSEMPRVPGYEFAARNRPARVCGGDYYDALRLPVPEGPERLLLCVADVAGKGLPAALVMSNMQATLRALLGRTESLQLLAEHASHLLYASTSPEKYVTAALAELTPGTGELRFVGAGHLDNVILRCSGDTEALASTGTPLGLLPAGAGYDETTPTLSRGDWLILFSDGVTDAQDADGNEFGEARLRDVLGASRSLSAEGLISRVFEGIDGFVGDAPQFDDITMLVARRLPA